LGNLGIVREDTRAAWSWSWFEQPRQDCRCALRGMRRNPLFTAMVASSLALGIGANPAITVVRNSRSYRHLAGDLQIALPIHQP
jgi:hypothetical protein